ncbi:MAG: transaldolase, partial [Chloroflexia bacterium]|nr:transaldolase [Chloroflexia bacterium]
MVDVVKNERPTNTIKQLHQEGQSVWLDDISRQMLQAGELKRQVEEIGIRGVTSNPTIFQKAIAGGDAYDDEIKRLLDAGTNASDIFESLAVADIRQACDVLRPLYDQSEGGDGFVSLEVSP